MVAINKILLPECTGERRGGGTGNPPREARLHARSPVHFLLSPLCRRPRPARDPVAYQGGINLYGYVNSSPVGSVDAEGASLWTALGGALGGLESQLGMLAEEALSAYNRAITALMLESLPPDLRTLPICKIPPLAHPPNHGPTLMKSETKGNFGPAGGSVSGGVGVPIGGTPFNVWGYGGGSLSPKGTFAPTKGMLGLSF
jgi:hypothetical protein